MPPLPPLPPVAVVLCPGWGVPFVMAGVEPITLELPPAPPVATFVHTPRQYAVPPFPPLPAVPPVVLLVPVAPVATLVQVPMQ